MESPNYRIFWLVALLLFALAILALIFRCLACFIWIFRAIGTLAVGLVTFVAPILWQPVYNFVTTNLASIAESIRDASITQWTIDQVAMISDFASETTNRCWNSIPNWREINLHLPSWPFTSVSSNAEEEEAPLLDEASHEASPLVESTPNHTLAHVSQQVVSIVQYSLPMTSGTNDAPRDIAIDRLDGAIEHYRNKKPSLLSPHKYRPDYRSASSRCLVCLKRFGRLETQTKFLCKLCGLRCCFECSVVSSISEAQQVVEHAQNQMSSNVCLHANRSHSLYRRLIDTVVHRIQGWSTIRMCLPCYENLGQRDQLQGVANL